MTGEFGDLETAPKGAKMQKQVSDGVDGTFSSEGSGSKKGAAKAGKGNIKEALLDPMMSFLEVKLDRIFAHVLEDAADRKKEQNLTVDTIN